MVGFGEGTALRCHRLTICAKFFSPKVRLPEHEAVAEQLTFPGSPLKKPTESAMVDRPQVWGVSFVGNCNDAGEISTRLEDLPESPGVR